MAGAEGCCIGGIYLKSCRLSFRSRFDFGVEHFNYSYSSWVFSLQPLLVHNQFHFNNFIVNSISSAKFSSCVELQPLDIMNCNNYLSLVLELDGFWTF